jgi:hypothetical protein
MPRWNREPAWRRTVHMDGRVGAGRANRYSLSLTRSAPASIDSAATSQSFSLNSASSIPSPMCSSCATVAGAVPQPTPALHVPRRIFGLPPSLPVALQILLPFDLSDLAISPTSRQLGLVRRKLPGQSALVAAFPPTPGARRQVPSPDHAGLPRLPRRRASLSRAGTQRTESRGPRALTWVT